MRVRKLDAERDMQFGQGQANFYRDAREGVGQCVLTRLELWQQDWFLDRTEGMTWRTKVLGRRTEAARDPAIRARVLGTQGVTAISSYASQQTRSTRGLAAQISIDTLYGQTIVNTGTANNADVDVRYGR